MSPFLLPTGTFRLTSKPIVALVECDPPRVTVFETEALIVTSAEATPGTPEVTSPPIVAENPVASDQLDVTDVEMLFDIFMLWPIAPPLLRDCSSTSVLITPRRRPAPGATTDSWDGTTTGLTLAGFDELSG